LVFFSQGIAHAKGAIDVFVVRRFSPSKISLSKAQAVIKFAQMDVPFSLV